MADAVERDQPEQLCVAIARRVGKNARHEHGAADDRCDIERKKKQRLAQSASGSVGAQTYHAGATLEWRAVMARAASASESRTPSGSGLRRRGRAVCGGGRAPDA